jgi:CRISPR/Cas system-associated endonuclease Cas3-HD
MQFANPFGGLLGTVLAHTYVLCLVAYDSFVREQMRLLDAVCIIAYSLSSSTNCHEWVSYWKHNLGSIGHVRTENEFALFVYSVGDSLSIEKLASHKHWKLQIKVALEMNTKLEFCTTGKVKRKRQSDETPHDDSIASQSMHKNHLW